MNSEKAVNHGAHGKHEVKTIDFMVSGIHPAGACINDCKLQSSVFSVPSVVIELRLLS